MEFSNPNCGVGDRRVIIITSKNDYNKMAFGKMGKDLLKSQIPIFGWKNSIETYKNVWKTFTGQNLLPYPLFNINNVKNYFEFPPQHPVINTAYATCDVNPNIYVPVANFHSYFLDSKYSSLMKLCADLGAKELYLNYSEVNNKSWNFDGSGRNIPTELGMLNIGINVNSNSKRNENGILFYTFSEENKEIKKYNSPWLKFEPKWEKMVQMRKENALKTFNVNFNYTDDFGINEKLNGSLNSIGVTLGGGYNEFVEIKLGINIVFW